MKIELLTTFLEVSQTLHFRVSAENLFLTQAAVSTRIKQLEQELGVLLFDRSTKRLKLTPEGHKLTKSANEMILMWQKLKHDVGVSDESSSQLFIGSMMSIWDIALNEWIHKLHRNLDDIHLNTHTYSPLELRKQIQNKLIDIAFVFEPPFVEDLITTKVSSVPLQLVTTTNNPDFYNIENMVMVDYGDSINSQYIRDFAESTPIRHNMSQPGIALNFILEVGGSAYLPKQMCFNHVRKNKLYLVPNAPVYNRDIYAMYLSTSYKSDLISDALQFFPYINQ